MQSAINRQNADIAVLQDECTNLAASLRKLRNRENMRKARDAKKENGEITDDHQWLTETNKQLALGKLSR